MFSLILAAALTVTAPITDVPEVPQSAVDVPPVIGTVSGNDLVGTDGTVVPGPLVDYNSLADALISIDEALEVVTLNASVDAYQVSDYYREYFKGVLRNMPYTEYLCYAERIPNGNYSTITHYYLMYDLEVENGQVVSGTYPCIDVYNADGVYYLNETTKKFVGYPTIGFASFEPYSALIDRSFPVNDLIVGLICIAVFYLICRKTVFS